MNDNLFQRINDESAIQIVKSENLYKAGYYWKVVKWQITEGRVYESQEAALISAINDLDECHKVAVNSYLQVINKNERLKEVLNPKILPFWFTWLEEMDKNMLGLYFFMALFSVGIFSLAFLELFLKSRCIPAT